MYLLTSQKYGTRPCHVTIILACAYMEISWCSMFLMSHYRVCCIVSACCRRTFLFSQSDTPPYYLLCYQGVTIMSTTIHGSIASRKGLDIQSLSFEERIQLGAENAIRCMGVTAQDRVFILTDYYRENIARQVANAALAQHADVTVRFLEHYGERPLKVFSDELRNDLINARPTV